MPKSYPQNAGIFILERGFEVLGREYGILSKVFDHCLVVRNTRFSFHRAPPGVRSSSLHPRRASFDFPISIFGLR